MRAAEFFMVRRSRRSAIPWRRVPRVGKATTPARLAGVAGAAALVAWAVVQYESRRPRPPEAEVDLPPNLGSVTADRVFQLHIDETVPVGFKRIAAGQIEATLERLEGRSGEELGIAVHEARKSLKRLRALVRLLRAELGDEVYGPENQTFREVGRALSGPRDSQVLIDALDALVERYPRELGAASLTGFRSQLVTAVETPRMAELADDLRAAEGRIAGWPIERRGIRAVAPGLERAYRRGRRAYRSAAREPSAENLHDWRKRVKDLWYSVQVLEQAGPKRMRKLARTAHELSELLGDDHDLVVLEERAEASSSDFPDTASPMLLRVMAEQRRAELQKRAFRIGSRLYRESPDKFVKRVTRGWRQRGGIR